MALGQHQPVVRACLINLPLVFANRCCRLVSDQFSTLFGSPSRRQRLPRLWATSTRIDGESSDSQPLAVPGAPAVEPWGQVADSLCGPPQQHGRWQQHRHPGLGEVALMRAGRYAAPPKLTATNGCHQGGRRACGQVSRGNARAGGAPLDEITLRSARRSTPSETSSPRWQASTATRSPARAANRTWRGCAQSRKMQDSVGIGRTRRVADCFLSSGRRRSEGSAVSADLAGHEPPHSLILRPACQAQHPVCRPLPAAPVVAGCQVGIVGAVEHLLQELGPSVAPEGIAAIFAPAARPVRSTISS